MKSSRRALAGAGIALIALVTSAHVGSPDTWFAGNAGPYRILVHIRAPGVIPGIAEVNVQVDGDEDIREVLANVNRFDAIASAPPPERAKPVRGQPKKYRLSLWVMTGGSNSVTVRVHGDRGEGVAVVPATIVAFRRLELTGPLAFLLGAVGLFLFAGAVTIVGAAVRESGLPPGEEPDSRRKRAAMMAMSATAAVFALVLFGGKRWWDSEDSAHRASMFRPLEARAYVDSAAGGKVLRFVITDTTWRGPAVTGPLASPLRRRFSPLVPDHGKLMHLFAVRDDLGAIAHLHPETTDTVTFTGPLPQLPPGRYRIFADVTHESGFAQTIPAAIQFSSEAGETAIGSAGDDSWSFVTPSENNTVVLDSARGITMRWGRGAGPIVAGQPAELRFRVTDATGADVQLEPYMGMPAHAAVVRDDGTVFIHLHPMGTISSTSQLAFEMRAATDTVPGMLASRLTTADSARLTHGMHGGTQNVLSFPYAFPAPGTYAIWVQVQHAGRVLTGAFAAKVAAQASP